MSNGTGIDKLYSGLQSNILNGVLSPNGFLGKKGVFVRDSSKTLQVVEFVKGVRSSKMSLNFTLNLALFNKEVLLFDGIHHVESAEKGHWKNRIGNLSDDGVDKWWQIQSEQEAHLVEAEISDLLVRKVLPIFDQNSLDDHIVEKWLSGSAQGITNFERLRCLAIVLKLRNRQEELASVCQELLSSTSGKPSHLAAKAIVESLLQ